MKFPHCDSKLAVKLLPLAIGLIYGSVAVAAGENNASQTTDKLETVVITAQKRKEKILDVPLAVTAISGEQLEARGIEGPKGLSGVIPNLNMSNTPVSGLIAAVGMRGISSGQPSIWADPSVGLYVDGVFVGKNMGALFDLVDIEQLEALRGPQGTLFGKNTEAGAINFVTRKPSGIFGGNFGVELGNFNRKLERISVDLAKMGNLSLSVAARNETQDGFITNPNGKAWGDKNRKAARIAARLEASKDLTIDFAADISRINETMPAGSLISSTGYGSLYPLNTLIGGTTYAFQNPTCLYKVGTVCYLPSTGIGVGMKQYVINGYPTSVAGGSVAGYQRADTTGNSVKVEYKINPDNTLKYTGSLRKMIYADAGDYDGTPDLIFQGRRDTDYSAFSNEFQLIGNSGPLRYVAGLYFYSDEGTTLQNQSGTMLTFAPQMIGYQAANFRVSSDSKAVYGQVDWDIDKSWTATLGGRYTQEIKGGTSWRYKTDANFVQGTNPLTVNTDASATFSKFTPSFNLLFRLNADTNIFGRYAQGFKSGGFPAEAPVIAGVSGPNIPFMPETSKVLEVGVKSSIWDGKGQISANLFRTDVSNYQVSYLPAGSINATIINAGKLRTQGLEIDAAARITRDLRGTLTYGYTDAKFGQYLTTSPTGAPIDAASNTVVSGAPKHTFNLNLDSRLATLSSGANLNAMVDFKYVADRYGYPGQISATAANATVGNTAAESLLPATKTLNVKLQMTGIKLGGKGEAEAAFWVKNVTNQHTMIAQMDVSGFFQMGYWSDPRTMGVTLNYRW